MNQELQVGVRFSDLAYMAKATLSHTITIFPLELFCAQADVTNKKHHTLQLNLARYIASFKTVPIHKILSEATKNGGPDFWQKL